MLRSLQHPVNSHFCTYMHLLPGVVDTFSHTHTVRDTLVGSCTISEEEEEDMNIYLNLAICGFPFISYYERAGWRHLKLDINLDNCQNSARDAAPATAGDATPTVTPQQRPGTPHIW